MADSTTPVCQVCGTAPCRAAALVDELGRADDIHARVNAVWWGRTRQRARRRYLGEVA